MQNKKNNNIDLSIIIPVYGTEQYLRKCLDSIFKNIPKNTEVIVINDGTKDNSEQIILEYEQKFKDILTYYKKENGGLSHTKNYGLQRANGKYITFVDSDDYVDQNMHKDMLNEAIKSDADIVYCDVEEIFEDKKNLIVNCINPFRQTDFFKAIDTPLMAASWNKLVKRELFEGLDYPNGLNNEDIAVTPILFARAKKIIHISKPYYKYLQRTGSIQNSTFNSKRFVIFKTSRICFERAKEFSLQIQEQIKGTIYTHQIFALLIYVICQIKDDSKKSLISEFCKLINEEGDSFYNNQYVLDYVKSLKVEGVFNALKEKNIDKISDELEKYTKKKNKIEKVLQLKNTILRPFRSIKRRYREFKIRQYEKKHKITPSV